MKLHESVVFDQDIATGERYLVNLETGKLFRVNQIAEIIIESIKDGYSISEIEDRVCERTNGSREMVKRDIPLFIDGMIEKGIVNLEGIE